MRKTTRRSKWLEQSVKEDGADPAEYFVNYTN